MRAWGYTIFVVLFICWAALLGGCSEPLKPKGDFKVIEPTEGAEGTLVVPTDPGLTQELNHIEEAIKDAQKQAGGGAKPLLDERATQRLRQLWR